MAMMSTKRLQKELAELNGVKGSPPAGISLLSADNLALWRLELQVLGESLYQGETFAVEFRFGPRYPIDSPAVVFVVNDKYKAPVHPEKKLPDGNDSFVKTAPLDPKKVRFVYDDDTV
ncbi:hypothetical protein FRC01_008822 [Tulasnella sp. 417]|nr:hypothetical protein FRC01_008822 [Tulasnella sp. 417]